MIGDYPLLILNINSRDPNICSSEFRWEIDMRYKSIFLAVGLSLNLSVNARAATIWVLAPVSDHLARLQAPVQAQHADPREEQLREQALHLTRNERRRIQRDLQDLDHDPGYTDGYFGRRTLAAVSKWQRDNGYWPTGYFSARQLREMRQDADAVRRGTTEHRTAADHACWIETRAEQGQIRGMRRYLERYPNGIFSAYARQQIREADNRLFRKEREFWADAQRLDTRRDYRSYLDRYPRGRFVSQARRRINELNIERRREVQSDHLDAWSDARQTDTIEAYEAYLRIYPNSRHASDARKRLKKLRKKKTGGVSEADMAAWRQAQIVDSIRGYEAYIQQFPDGDFVRDAKAHLAELRRSRPNPDDNLSAFEKQYLAAPGAISRLQQWLLQAGYGTGPSTGLMNEQTRDAIRRLQGKHGREMTGYIDQWTAQKLMERP